MPFQIKLEHDLIRLTYTGFVTKAEIFASAQEIARLEGELPNRPDQITDLSGIEGRETNYQTLSSVAKDRQAKTFYNAFKIALVAPTPLSFGLARMFQTLMDHPQIKVEVFNTMIEAEQWLGIKR